VRPNGVRLEFRPRAVAASVVGAKTDIAQTVCMPLNELELPIGGRLRCNVQRSRLLNVTGL